MSNLVVFAPSQVEIAKALEEGKITLSTFFGSRKMELAEFIVFVILIQLRSQNF